jgi:uncharacterized membrane protein
MIFGLALSIGAVTLLVQRPGNITGVFYSLISFGFAFLVLALVWLRYSRIMSVLPVEGSGVVAANMILLFLVSIEPYLLNLLFYSAYNPSAATPLDSAATTTLYALDWAGLMAILAYFLHELTVEEKRLIPKDLLKSYRLTMYTTILTSVIFLASTLPVFWSIIVIQSPIVPLRYVLWNGIWVVNIGRRLVDWVAGRGRKGAGISGLKDVAKQDLTSCSSCLTMG